MDILTHTISGLTIGATLSCFPNRGIKDKLSIIGVSGFAAAFPDVDAISLWSGFDQTFGKVFHLANPAKEIYFSKFWYSHHGFFHSLFASIAFVLLFGTLTFYMQNWFKSTLNSSLKVFIKNNFLIFIGFIASYDIHLLEDMPTPSCTWGGVRLLWPLKTYFGGTGKIWWWNNYDIFLIILSTLFLIIILIFLNNIKNFKTWKFSISAIIIGASLCIFQINSRNYDFNYFGQTSKYNAYEKKSKEIQKEILGSTTYKIMEHFDKKVKMNF